MLQNYAANRDDLQIRPARNRRDHRDGTHVGKTNFTGEKRLNNRGRASDLNVLDVESVFPVNTTVNRDLNMIRCPTDVRYPDLGQRLCKERIKLSRDQ